MANWRDMPLGTSETLVDCWLSRFEAARSDRKYQTWRAVADQCMAFYRNSAKFMWEPEFAEKYIGDIDTPRFQITINKPWEYVQVIGPYLMWDYPARRVQPYEPLRLKPEQLTNDPWLQERLAEREQVRMEQHARASVRAELMHGWLNYTPREQPEGLRHHSQLAVVDAMLMGRGLLVPRSYRHPGSDRVMTGLFRESPYDLLVDPDCSDPLLTTAKWIAIRHVSTVWELEDRFHLKRGTLEEAGNLASADEVMFNRRSVDGQHRAEGVTNDLVVWYEVWSRTGVGARRSRVDADAVKRLDQQVGDYAYLCVAPSVPWFLNAPPAKLKNETLSDEGARDLFAWPFPCWADSRWPVAILDFNLQDGSPWPLPPLGAALGEMVAMNVLTSAFVEHAYENRKQLIAVMDDAAKEVESQLRGSTSPAVVRLRADAQRSIKQVVEFLQRPSMNTDILAALEYVGMLFEHRTGLNEFMYGSERTQSRTAKDVAAKEEKTAIRPEKMSRDVASWQTNAATLEMLLSTLEVTGADVEPRLDGELWDEFIAQEDPELVMREMSVLVEATDIRRPNRERDLEALGTLSQQFLPVFQVYAQDTGDSGPINAMIQKTGTAMELPMHEMELGPWRPEVPPEVQEQQQMAMEAEQMKTQAELEGRQMDLMAKQQDVEQKRELAEIKTASEAQRLQFDAIRAQMEMDQDQAQHQLDLIQSQQQFGQQMRQREQEGSQKLALMRAQQQATPQTSEKET